MAHYPLPPPPVDASRSAFAWLSEQLAPLQGGATAIRLAGSALADSTRLDYGRHWALFAQWCADQGVPPVPASPTVVAAYLGYLAERGTIAASSLQPYLSAINRVHADLGLDRPALGHLIASVRRGLARTQTAVRRLDSRVPLPAPAVEAVLDDGLRVAATATLPPRALADTLRNAYATVLTFIFLGRQDSSVALHAADHGIDPEAIWLRLQEKQRKHLPTRRVIRLPLRAAPAAGQPSALPRVARLGAAFLAAKARLGEAAPGKLFQLPGEREPTTPAMSGWLRSALARVGVAAPPGFAYQGHSLRSGGASAAEAIRVPPFRANWLGGWSNNSRVREQFYIDPSVRPTPAAYRLLGWLLHGEFDLS